MDFSKRMLPTSMNYAFRDEGYFVWGAYMFKYKEYYYIIYSRWKQELGFSAWVTDSQVCLAKSEAMLGKFHHVKVLFDNESAGIDKKIVIHNPTVIRWEGKFYLYHMVTHGTEDRDQYRKNQRIGVAYAEDPEGEWIREEKPVIDVSENGIDSLVTSNPAALVTDDNRILMIYKAVSKDGEQKVLCGVAEANHPCGPFIKHGKPIMENPENRWCVEDPHIWFENGKYYALVKDFQGYFTKTKRCAIALFVSENGKEWKTSETPLAIETKLHFENETKEVYRLERPQLYFEEGRPKCLLCACMVEDSHYTSTPTVFNIRIPLK